MATSTVTTERLRDYANDSINNINGEIRAMAAELLAVREAQSELDKDARDAFERFFKMPRHVERCGKGYCITEHNAWLAQEFINRYDGWSACRAAMLNHSEQALGKIEPVTPTYKLHELISAIRTINRSPQHIAEGVNDDEPCYWQRKEWIGWVLGLCDEVEQSSNSPVIPDGWIKCSERMPADNDLVLVWDGKYRYTCFRMF